MCLICPNHECAHFRPFWAIFHIFCPPCTMFTIFGVISRAHLAGAPFRDKPANGPHIARGSSLYSQPTLASLTFVKGRLWSAPEAMRCEQGVFFAIFHFCMCPLGRQRARPSKAPQVEHISGIEGHWCQVIVFRRIGRLLNPGRRYYNIFVRLSRHFWVFFRQYCCFLPVMMSSGDRVSQRCAQLTS